MKYDRKQIESAKDYYQIKLCIDLFVYLICIKITNEDDYEYKTNI